ncbi:MAG TPA: fatty acid desaturase, partial [Polyangiales bacterium]|nr:fatty acid desaturase [Polyangiales bacterium]
MHGAVIGLAQAAIVRDWLAAPFLPVLSLVIGASFAGLTFLGHEALHGAVVRNRWLRHAVGWVGFLPFTISPTLWVAWHNRVHHGHTNHAELDPDAYPTLDAYNHSRAIRVAIELAPGRSRWTLALALCFGFSAQSAQVLLRARRPGYLSNRAYARAW